MAKFDVYANPSAEGYLIDLQTDFLAELGTRLVAPLTPIASGPVPTKRLHPIFLIDGDAHIMLTHLMGAVPTTILKSPVANVSDHFAEVTSALDMVFQGY